MVIGLPRSGVRTLGPSGNKTIHVESHEDKPRTGEPERRLPPHPAHILWLMYSRRYKSKSQRPCDFCRRRRSACRIVAAPPCELCKSHSRQCTFANAPPPRKPRVEATPAVGMDMDGDDPGLHAAPALELSSGVADVLDDAWAASYLSHNGMNGIEATPDTTLMSNFLAVHDVESDPPRLGDEHDPANTTAIDPHMHSEPAVGPSHGRHRELISHSNSVLGATDPLDPFVMRQYRYDANSEVPFRRIIVRSVSRGPDPVHFFAFRGSTEDSSGVKDVGGGAERRGRAHLDSLVSADVGTRLVNLYFKFVFPLFPVVTPRPEESHRPFSATVLAAVYLVALDFTTFDDVLCIETAYDLSPRKSLEEFVWSALHEHRNRPTIDLLQSALLLALSPTGDMLMPENDERLRLGSIIVSMANTLGLQHDPSEWDLPPSEIALRCRLSCLVRANDTWLGAATGRPSFISSDNWLVDVVTAVDVHEDKVDVDALENFIRFSQLSNILRNVLDGVYSLKASRELSSDFGKTLSITEPLMESLDEWHRQLPCNNTPEDASSMSNVSGFLYLGYHAVRTLVFRAIMRPIHNARYAHLADGDRPELDAICEKSRVGTRDCCVEFLSYIRDLDSKEFHSFWPFWTTWGFALQPQLATMLFLSSRSEKEALENKSLVSQSRQLLRLRAKSFDYFRLALLRADSIWWRGLRETVYLSPEVERSLDEANDTSSSAIPTAYR